MNYLLKLKLWARQVLLRWRNADTRRQSVLGRAYDRLAGWVTRVTWKRLFLVSILILILGGLITSVLDDLLRGKTPRPFVHLERDTLPTKVVIEADANGVRVRSIDASDSKKMQQTIKDAAQGARDAAQGIRDAAQAARDAAQHARDAAQAARDGLPVPPASPASPAAPVPPVAPDGNQDVGEVIFHKDNLEVRLAKTGELPEGMDEIIEEIKNGIAEGAGGKAASFSSGDSGEHDDRSRIADTFMPILLICIFGLITLKVILNTQRKAQVQVAAAEEATEREALKRQVVEAKFTTMQAQVEPHFLFNTLASVDHLIEVDPPRASQMQKNLIQYLRAAMPHMRDNTSNMGREAQLVTSYLKILQFRMEERLQFSVDIPDGLYTAEVPPMMLLSLVENAIKHGLEPKPEGGRLDVKAEIAHGKLRVSVADTGLGFKPNGAATSGTGIGLSNIRERLAMIYGSAADFTIGANSPSGTVAVIQIPYKLTSTPAPSPV